MSKTPDIWLKCEWRRVDMPPAYVYVSAEMIVRAMADLRPDKLDAFVKLVDERAEQLESYDAERDKGLSDLYKVGE